MEKVGILTFHRAINYGAALQCYCLYKVLCSLGYDVSVVDYRPNYIEHYRLPFSNYEFRKRKGFLSKLKYLIGVFSKFRLKMSNNKEFDNFFKDIKFVSVKQNQIVDGSSFNAFIIGSDQVWCPRITDGIDPFFWGTLLPNDVRLVSYAASMGPITETIKSYKNVMVEKLTKFSSISMREGYAAEYMRNITGAHVTTVVDPTLLANREILEKITNNVPEKDYVLYYTLKEESGMFEFAKDIAKQLGCKVVRVKPFVKHGDTNDCINISGVGPQEFCSYIKHARCIVCKSFHGTIISSIFNKDFYSFSSSKEDRAEAFLRSIGLENRLVCPGEKRKFEPVDFSVANNQMHGLQMKSLAYLKTALAR